MRSILVGLGIAAAFALAVPAMAQVRVVDQDNSYAQLQPGQVSVGVDVASHSPLGQTFTPSLARIDFAEFDFSNPFDNKTVNYSVSLYAGDYSLAQTAALTTSNVVPFAPSQSFRTLQFRFTNGNVLIPGQTYTLRLNQVGDQDTNPYTRSSTNTYLGGHIIDYGGSSDSRDLIFSEGILAATPEPATWGLMIVGFGAVGGSLRRRGARRLARTITTA